MLAVICCQSGFKDHKANQCHEPKRSLLLLEGVHEVVFVFSLGDCLKRCVEPNCQLKLLVFDRAPGLYPGADDNTDAGQHKPKFISPVNI